MLKEAKKTLKREAVLIIAICLAATSSIFQQPDIKSIDFDVLGVLFSLMLVVAGLKSIKFLDWLAMQLINRCNSFRAVTGTLTAISFVSSMFVTNDVALITFVPLALIIGRTIRMDMIRPIIMMTMAANLGSMFTPQGNPQNLFLYTHFAFDSYTFLKIMALPTLLSILYLAVLNWHTKTTPIELSLDHHEQPNKITTTIYILLLLLNIAAVLHLFDKWATIGVTLGLILIMNWQLIKQVDYSLLLTFIGFFIFIGNVQHTDFIFYIKNSVLNTELGTYIGSILLSQVISNVPAAMLLAGLTQHAGALLLGVNIGGLGTLIASMASVISYKLFAQDYPTLTLQYFKAFTFYNILGLIIIGVLTAVANYI